MIDYKRIKLIIWDLDETLWEGTLSDNDTLIIKDDFVDLIQMSLDRGIVHSICSKNDFDATKIFLESQGLWDLFVFPSINWEPKGARIQTIIRDMKLRSENVLFVDDNAGNLREAAFYSPGIMVCTPEELRSSAGDISDFGSVDKTRPRLAQYRLLEEKVKSQKTFSSNEDFLMTSRIIVEFHDDCLEHLDRIHDLIMRSNQLNYTKFRQDKESLAADLSLSDTQAAYITVKDAFGDYGIVGFYMIVGGTVKHFLFSCRILGMLVEQYVYMKIGCPAFEVTGDVLTELNRTLIPPWINQADKNEAAQQGRSNTGALRILFKGPCDISQIFSFMEQTNTITTEFTYVNDNGISVEGYNHTSQLVTALKATDAEKAILIDSSPWLDAQMLDASSWRENDAIILSILTDGNLGVYRHKQTGWQIALCEKYYDLTDPKNRDDYINKRIFTSQIDFSEESLRDFAEKYQYVNNDDGELTLQNLEILYHEKKSSAKLILILGSEYDYVEPKKPSYKDRHLFHKMLNRKIEAWAENKADVYLIKVDHYIESRKDYIDTINHFQKRVYYYMAKDILSVLGDEQSDAKVKNKLFLYRATLESKMKRSVKKLLKRS